MEDYSFPDFWEKLGACAVSVHQAPPWETGRG